MGYAKSAAPAKKVAAKKVAKPKKAEAPTKTEAKSEVVTSYKGFDANLQCRGFQFELGKSYTHQGEVKACEGGFHACEDPLNVLRYYAPNKSRYAIVEQSGQLSSHDDDTKIASQHIAIKTEISIADLVKVAIKFRMDRCTISKESVSDKPNTAVSASGKSVAATASGYYGAATASGNSGAATASGNSGAATASGNSVAATASGYSGAATASGYYGAATASGDYGAATASGNSGAATASGYYGAATASGDYGAATASGNSGAATASGYYGAATASGDYGAATAIGRNGKARGKDGCAIFLVRRDSNWKITHVFSEIVGQNGIKPDVFYTLGADGQPVECEA